MQEDIRRSVLFLINGFGVDKRDIYDVLNDKNVPNLNKLARENIFSSLQNGETEFKSAYKTFSTSMRTLPGYKKVNEDIINNFEGNEKFGKIVSTISSTDKKLHVFCYLDNETTIEQTKKIVACMQAKGVKNKILIHVILKTLKDQNYKKIENNISSLKMITFNNPNAEIGVFFGNEMLDENVEDTKELYKMLITEVGERWPDFVRKIDILKNKNVKPGNIKPFFISSGFKLTEGDFVLILNYEFVDYSNFIDIIQNPKLHFALSNLPQGVNAYSLFPLRSKTPIESIYENEIAENYLVKYMEKLNTKALVLTDQNRIIDINNNCNGLQNIKSDRLDFMVLQDNMPIPNIVTNPNYQLIIFDYDIGNVGNMEELISSLNKIDAVLGQVAQQCKMYDYSLFVSSLYGINKEWKRDKTQVYTINYTGEVPLIIADRLTIKGKHMVGAGTTANILPTICKNMNNNLPVNSLISVRKKGLFGF